MTKTKQKKNINENYSLYILVFFAHRLRRLYRHGERVMEREYKETVNRMFAQPGVAHPLQQPQRRRVEMRKWHKMKRCPCPSKPLFVKERREFPSITSVIPFSRLFSSPSMLLNLYHRSILFTPARQCGVIEPLLKGHGIQRSETALARKRSANKMAQSEKHKTPSKTNKCPRQQLSLRMFCLLWFSSRFCLVFANGKPFRHVLFGFELRMACMP